MRRMVVAGWLCGLALLGGCDWLSDDPPPAARPTAPLAQGCPLPFAAAAQDAGRSLAMADGTLAWLFSAPLQQDRSDGLLVHTPEVTPADCSAQGPETTTIALPPTATDTDLASPLASVQTASGLWLFYEAWVLDAAEPFGVRITGRGVARWDPSAGQFVRLARLWSGSGPNWGTSALADGNDLYVYGCEGYGFLQRRCYAAQVPAANPAEAAAYRYLDVNQQWNSAPALAEPVATDVGDWHVTKHASGQLLATYFTPLGDTAYARTAKSPIGPFSAPLALFRCPLGPDEFCTGAARHPLLETAGTLVLTYARSSFEAMSAERRQPRLVALPLPDNLP